MLVTVDNDEDDELCCLEDFRLYRRLLIWGSGDDDE